MPRRRRKSRLNNPEARKALKKSWKFSVASVHGTKCYYCKAELVILNSIEKKDRIFQDGNWITYFDRSTQRGAKKLIFTLDHVIELRRGGKTDLTNLVPACHKCNNRRSNRQRKKHGNGQPRPSSNGGAWNLD